MEEGAVRWRYAENVVVDITNEKELVTIANVLFDNMLDVDGDKKVTYEDWLKFFKVFLLHESFRKFLLFIFIFGLLLNCF